MKSFKDFINEKAMEIPYKGPAFKTYDKIVSTAGSSHLTNTWYPFKNGSNIQFVWYTNNAGTLYLLQIAKTTGGAFGLGVYKLTKDDTIRFEYPLWDISIKEFKSKFKTEKDGNKFFNKVFDKITKMNVKQSVKDIVQKIYDEMN